MSNHRKEWPPAVYNHIFMHGPCFMQPTTSQSWQKVDFLTCMSDHKQHSSKLVENQKKTHVKGLFIFQFNII